jgi:hypothetical protein
MAMKHGFESLRNIESAYFVPCNLQVHVGAVRHPL